jgi:hypothetical protein
MSKGKSLIYRNQIIKNPFKKQSGSQEGVPSYAEGIYRYYGLQPYWEEEMR